MLHYPLQPGVNFSPAERLPADVLCAALAATVSFLQRSGAPAHLRRFDDWLQHDELMFEHGDITLPELFRMIETPRALLAAMPGDFQVRIGVAPTEGPWYMRFILDWDDTETHLEGDFDVTLPPALAAQYRQDVVPALPFAVVEEDAEGYFERIVK
jgi:hypothetical protein